MSTRPHYSGTRPPTLTPNLANVSVGFERVQVPADHQRLVGFLCDDEWPFHARRRLTPDDVDSMEFAGADATSFWLLDGGRTVGLLRLLDLGDIGEGAPLIDVRVAGRYRGRGLGGHATDWAVAHLLGEYPELHRIEANTRIDNIAMRRALVAAGFTHEGTLRQAWRNEASEWFDAAVYGILRTDPRSAGA